MRNDSRRIRTNLNELRQKDTMKERQKDKNTKDNEKDSEGTQMKYDELRRRISDDNDDKYTKQEVEDLWVLLSDLLSLAVPRSACCHSLFK